IRHGGSCPNERCLRTANPVLWTAQPYPIRCPDCGSAPVATGRSPKTHISVHPSYQLTDLLHKPTGESFSPLRRRPLRVNPDNRLRIGFPELNPLCFKVDLQAIVRGVGYFRITFSERLQ